MKPISLPSRPGRLLAALGAAAVITAVSVGSAAAATAPHSAGSSATVTTHAAKPKPQSPANTYPAVKPHFVPKPARSAHSAPQVVRPATAWSVTMSASSYSLWGTQTTTLTATTNIDVQPTIYWILIYEDDKVIQACGSGTTCTVSVSYPTPQTHGYQVDIAEYNGADVQTWYPNSGGFTACDGLCVTWHGVDFTMSNGYSTLPINGVTTVTATASESVGPSPFWIDIFDTTTGTLAGSPCGYSATCTATVSETAAGTHKFVAYLADNTTAYPPTRTQSTSAPVWETWGSTGYQLSLSGPASDTSWTTVTATANVDLTNTPYYIEIFDNKTGLFYGSCKTGTTCSVRTYGNAYGNDEFVAFIANNDTAYPPAGIQASSNILHVTIYQLIP